MSADGTSRTSGDVRLRCLQSRLPKSGNIEGAPISWHRESWDEQKIRAARAESRAERGLGAALIGPSSSHRIMAVKASQETVEESMDSTVTPTPPKFPRDFTVAHLLDRIGRSPTEVDGDDAKVGGLCRKRRTSQMSLRSSQISLGQVSIRWRARLSARWGRRLAGEPRAVSPVS